MVGIWGRFGGGFFGVFWGVCCGDVPVLPLQDPCAANHFEATKSNLCTAMPIAPEIGFAQNSAAPTRDSVPLHSLPPRVFAVGCLSVSS